MRKKEGNKEKDILEAVSKVFAKEGFHQAKISKIAELANIATGSVYLYFKNKDSILSKMFEEMWQKIYEETKNLADRTDINPLEKFENMLDVVFDLFISNPSLAIVVVSEENYMLRGKKSGFTSFYESFLDLGEEILKEGINKNLFNPNLDIKVFRNFTFGGMRYLLQLWAQSPDKYPLTTIRQNVKFILKKAILLA